MELSLLNAMKYECSHIPWKDDHISSWKLNVYVRAGDNFGKLREFQTIFNSII